MAAFDQAFRIVIGEEGGLTTNPADPGNWTGGACGRGVCLGTRYGISAAAYPGLAIATLTLDAARAIYRRDYWDPVQGDSLPPPLALLVFDAAVNSGVSRAICWQQAAAGVATDGVLGPRTLAAVGARAGQGATLATTQLVCVLAEFQAQRLVFMAGLPTWRSFGLGWARRLCRLPYDAVAMSTT